MPTIHANGVDLFYKESGSGPETIVFSHGLLMDHTMFEPQRAAFEKQYRVIAYDHRAQGQSQDPGQGYDMDTLADDAAALITRFERRAVPFCWPLDGRLCRHAPGRAPSCADTHAHA